jgi:hypothetical protein
VELPLVLLLDPCASPVQQQSTQVGRFQDKALKMTMPPEKETIPSLSTVGTWIVSRQFSRIPFSPAFPSQLSWTRFSVHLFLHTILFKRVTSMSLPSGIHAVMHFSRAHFSTKSSNPTQSRATFHPHRRSLPNSSHRFHSLLRDPDTELC